LGGSGKQKSKKQDYIIELADEQYKAIGSLSFVLVKLTGYGFCCELGKYIGNTKALNKGYATEATRYWLMYGFDYFGLDSVIARTRTTNNANIKINDRLGFKAVDWPIGLDRPSDIKEWLFMKITNIDFVRN